MIYQVHAEHGHHMPINAIEAQANEKNGWKTVSEEEFYNIEVIEGEAVEIDENELSPHDKLSLAYEIKFGKKPHHMMKDETIQAKLDE